ncbi:unnamed protein product, partial [Didymodactylos carnosus]
MNDLYNINPKMTDHQSVTLMALRSIQLIKNVIGDITGFTYNVTSGGLSRRSLVSSKDAFAK